LIDHIILRYLLAMIAMVTPKANKIYYVYIFRIDKPKKIY